MLAVIYVEFSLSYSLSGIGLAAMLALMAIEMIYLSFTLPLLFPLIVRYENTLGNMFKNAFLLNISNLGTWFYLFFIWVIPIALYLSNSKILYYTWTLWILLWVALLAYASSMVIDKLFRKIEGRDDENEDETATKKTSSAGSDNNHIESESADIKTADEKAKTERKNNEKLKRNTENNVESSIKDNKKNNTQSTAKNNTKGNANNQKKSISEILEKTSNK
jgi:membrane protein implicated in regulation of membrane protease activity